MIETRWEPFAIDDHDEETLALQHFLADYAEWKSEVGSAVELERETGGDTFRVVRAEGLPVAVYTVEIDTEFYGEDEAVVVECEVGPLEEEEDLEELLRFADAELIVSRLGLTERNGDEVLVVEAALPFSRLTTELMDLMVNEVASIARELLEGGEEEDLEDED